MVTKGARGAGPRGARARGAGARGAVPGRGAARGLGRGASQGFDSGYDSAPSQSSAFGAKISQLRALNGGGAPGAGPQEVGIYFLLLLLSLSQVMCNCGERAVQRTVQKEGANQGRDFWACPRYGESGLPPPVSPPPDLGNSSVPTSSSGVTRLPGIRGGRREELGIRW